MPPNPYLLAADNSPALLPLLQENPALASAQDDHGYSLVHAAASYNHLDLLRVLIHEFKVDVNLKDEDGETALFVVETVGAARCLVEELKADVQIRGADGVTAREKIEGEAEFPDVAEYLASVERERSGQANGVSAAGPGQTPATATATATAPAELPPVPEGLSVSVGTIQQAEDVPEEVDPEFRRRIEQLAEREDFHTPEGQAELRKLVEDALLGQDLASERNVRPREG
ncbi:ankyrin repeat-containing protein [Sodiomyces alkalinus F11]|uniref:Ankyrin repeat-containing protein n=1 Tax=Sodiomyces alkalinus (strain CBS 110278 / VKM F-3762 / F11) TaxID=1314773 RepID=A0A3N2PQH1_SODAK|nr:ankyrin repeat-containing protein [Sodiomyces alkalinus F11]ROT36728.1 ankyrin repeat-containing protein [Sodiomyces alkalinus F11]